MGHTACKSCVPHCYDKILYWIRIVLRYIGKPVPIHLRVGGYNKNPVLCRGQIHRKLACGVYIGKLSGWCEPNPVFLLKVLGIPSGVSATAR